MECLKVLVVHRQAEMLEEINAILERFEPNLRGFNCGFDGLQAAKLEHFDLILCGTDLPLITGFEMVRSIRNLSRNCFTPVIFISDAVHAEHESISRQLKAHAIIGRRNLEATLNIAMEHAPHLNEGNRHLLNQK